MGGLVEEMEMAIIQVAYSGNYGHAENVLHRLRQLEERHDTGRAIEILYHEIVD
jgi:hypothetical protein